MENTPIIVITGANKGIGYECVRQFCELYPDKLIVALSRTTDNLAQLPYTNLESIKCDVTQFEQLNAKLDRFSLIEGLINCAGTASLDDFCNIEHSINLQMLNTNIIGLTNMLEIVIPSMRQNSNGTIISVSSLADRYPRPNAAIYGASKSYVKSISDSLRISEAKYNIRVCNISPALIDTPLSRSVRDNSITKIDVADFVNIIKFTYSQPQSICIRDMVVAPTIYES